MDDRDFETLGIVWSLAFTAATQRFGRDLKPIGGPADNARDPKGDFWPFELSGGVTGEGGAILPEPFLKAIGVGAPEFLAALVASLAEVIGCRLEVSVGAKTDGGTGSLVSTPVRVGQGKKGFDVAVCLRDDAARLVLDAFASGVGADDEGAPAIGEDQSGDAPDAVRPVRWPPFTGQEPTGPLPNLELFYDVPLTLTAELGRVERRVEDVMSMGPGAVVELDRTVGEAVDILANGQWIGRGEVVVVEENFGVRITEIGTTQERATKLRLREGS